MKKTKIKRKTVVRETTKVYDIEVENSHHYILDSNLVSHNSMFPQDVMGGGSGLQYAASNIIFLSKRKEKVGTDVIGNIIHCKNFKSRLTKENKMVDVLLSYDQGLNRYYGLLELAEKYDVIKKVSTRYELPDGTKLFGKQIMNDPEKYFTQEIMEAIDKAADLEFSYGKGTDAELSPSDETEQATEE